jgi:hypothetical protein
MMKTFLKMVTPEWVKIIYRFYKFRKPRRAVIQYLRNIHRTDEQQEVLAYLKHNPFSTHPYHYTKKYNPKDITVYTDKEKGMRYVLHDNKRLYFRRDWDEQYVKELYNGLLVEQDVASPHRMKAWIFVFAMVMW